jgi:hypothetical protein
LYFIEILRGLMFNYLVGEVAVRLLILNDIALTVHYLSFLMWLGYVVLSNVVCIDIGSSNW